MRREKRKRESSRQGNAAQLGLTFPSLGSNPGSKRKKEKERERERKKKEGEREREKREGGDPPPPAGVMEGDTTLP
jgi:septal ring factor EnvC (AmiA/AmiB activator)